MNSPRQVAAGFTITGLLDGASRTRGRYPVSEIAVADIADHPANAAYSMDPAGIAELAESIREDGLTDLPLVRKVGDGSWQMVSGHRRKAAYALLAKDDPAYERMPCRVIEGIDDERAVTLLHAANYFTRALTVTERAAATEALRGDAVRLRSEDPSLLLALPQNQPNAPLYPAGGAPGSRPGALPHFGRPRYLGPPPRARSTAG